MEDFRNNITSILAQAPLSIIVARSCQNITQEQPLPLIALSDKESQLLENKQDLNSRYQFCLARKLIKHHISEHLSIPTESIETLPDHKGKPLVVITNKNNGDAFSQLINVSISHSKQWLLFNLHSGDTNQAVDIEQINLQRKIYKFSEKYYTITEKQFINSCDNPFLVFYRLWSIKECLYKIDNDTMPHRISFEFNQDELANVEQLDTIIKYKQKNYRINFLVIDTNFISCNLAQISNSLKHTSKLAQIDIGFL